LAAIMLDLMSALGRRAADALRAAHPNSLDKIPEELTVVRAGKPEFGDLQCSAALQLGKALGQKPRDLAQAIADAMGGHEAVARVEIAGPGFVNVHLADAWMAAAAARGATLRPIGAGQRVVIDYSSPNVAKPMHIGHIRSTIIGEAIKRVLRAVGYEVIGDNHLGDWGTQFGKLIVAYRRWVDRAAFERSPVDELLRLYVKFTDEEKRQQAELGAAGGGEAAQTTEEDDEGTPKPVTPLLAEARAELVKLQAGDPENVALWKQFVDVSMREFDRVYQRLGVSFDVTLGESFYNDRLAATVKLLVDRGIAEESKGAMVVFFTKERDGEELPPFLIRKADGGYNYGTTDVAGVLYRMERWSPTRILIVTDERQQLHFKQLFAVARRLGVKASQEHIWFGLMRLPEGTFSTRDGNVIGLEALLDEAERRALALAQEKNAERAEGGEPALSEAELREVARVVGIGAVKYNDLSKDRQTLVTFTWDKALSLQGNTAPYLQYAYARIRSILRKAEKEAGAQPGAIGALAPAERALASKLLGFDEAVEQVARTTRPHILAEYLFDLSQAFSTFYNECPVLKAEPAVRAGRLTLCAQTAETLRRGLDLLGIEVLERM
jgi:arginyl-tRNA synthetase